MLKYILLLMSEYYYKIVSERMEEIREKMMPYQITLILRKIAAAGEEILSEFDFAEYESNSGTMEETLILTDNAQITEKLLEKKDMWWFFIMSRTKKSAFRL